ncbi:MAG: hypothetical protein WCT10_01285 [Patescibacteria group bacterium]
MFGKETPQDPKTPAKCWRTDLKWLYGILFVFSAMAGLFCYTAAQYTDEETVVGLSAHVFAALASPKGLDDETDVASLRVALSKSGGEEMKPFSGLAVKVRESDLIGLTPREVRLFLFRQVGEPIWEDGEAGLKRVAESEAAAAAMKAQGGVGVFGFLSEKNHKLFNDIYPYILCFAFFMLIGVIRFSSGFGQLVSPGIALLIGALPGALLTGWIRQQVETLAAGPSTLGTDLYGYIGYAAGQALLEEVRTIGMPYGVMFLIGFLLLFIAFVGNGLIFMGAGMRSLVGWLRQAAAKKK